MTEQELKNKIAELEKAAGDDSMMRIKLNKLKIKLEGNILSGVLAKMEAISLPDIAQLDAQIQQANNAQLAHDKRVNAFNSAYNFLKGIVA